MLLAGTLLVATLLGTIGWDRTWRVWNVQVAVQKFLDSQVIAAGASSWRDGYDPLRFNPHDIGHRPMNYPRVWQTLFVFGFEQKHAEAFGWTLAALLLLGVLLAFPALSWGEAVAVGLAVFSPAVLLGVERGNTDLAVFFVLAAALALPSAAWRTTSVVVAFALKLFPLAGAAVLLGQARRTALWCGAVLTIFAAMYVVANWVDLRLISAGTPRDTWLSYGWAVLPLRVGRLSPTAGAVAVVLAWTMIVLVAWRALRARAAAGEVEFGADAALDAFRVGAACYAGTFLLGNNFLYRLVFVILALPRLWRWARGGALRGSAWLGLVASFASLWLLEFDRSSWVVRRDEWLWFSVGQAANWVLFASFCCLLIRTLPGWSTDWLRRWMGEN